MTLLITTGCCFSWTGVAKALQCKAGCSRCFKSHVPVFFGSNTVLGDRGRVLPIVDRLKSFLLRSDRGPLLRAGPGFHDCLWGSSKLTDYCRPGSFECVVNVLLFDLFFDLRFVLNRLRQQHRKW